MGESVPVATRKLTFRPGSLVIITGLPGAGKSTLLRRLYGLSGQEDRPHLHGPVSIIDSGQSRLTWAGRLSWAPKQVRTAVVWATHVGRISRALSAGRSVVAHNRGGHPLVLYGFAWLARRGGLHLILLEVDPEQARQGQRSRGRVVPGPTFARHVRRHEALLARVRTGDLEPAASVTVLTRPAADLVEAIDFTAGP
ncbi:AAA family ATPase [Nonomuraea soli]